VESLIDLVPSFTPVAREESALAPPDAHPVRAVSRSRAASSTRGTRANPPRRPIR
jgi:hypothetical protein